MQTARCVRAGFLLAGALAVSSCGGGGGSSPPPPPPSAVTATASASAASVQEGQPFSVDASASATTNGSPLAYAWTQVSGPAVTIANPNTARLDLSAAEVTADATAQFRVTVTAGAAAAQATTSVAFTNIAETPAYGTTQTLATVSFTTPVRKVFGGDLNLALAGYAANTTDPLAFLDFSLSGSTLQVAPSQLGNLPQSVQLQMTRLYIGAAIADQQFTAVDENADRVRVFTRALATGAITTRGDFTLTDPCAVSQARLSSNNAALFVGQRAGFSILQETTGGGGPTLFLTQVTGRPACALVAPTLQLSGAFLNSPAPGYPHVIGFDSTTGELVVYAANTGGPGVSYSAVQTATVQLNASKPLTLAAWTPLEASTGPAGMALVFTDGAHSGEHRLVLAGFDAARSLVQATYSLGLGVPIEVFIDNVDADINFPEIVVVKSTSPQAEIFEQGPNAQGYSPLGSAKFLEIGLGASSAFRSGIFGLQGITVASPAKSEVKVIGALP